MEALKAYLNGDMAWDNSVLECMSKQHFSGHGWSR